MATLEAKRKNLLKEILTSNVYDIATTTPLEKSELLSTVYSNSIYLKREDKQVSGSFKIRGIYNKIKKIAKVHKKLICASTGNYAYSLSLVAKKFDCFVLAVMPKTTDLSTVDSLEKIGTRVMLQGDCFDECLKFAKSYSNAYYFVDPLDDEDIMAGNGSVGMETVNQFGHDMEKLYAIFVPVGTGSLISGLALYIKELYPNVKIIGVGLEGSCAMHESLKEKKVIELKTVNKFISSSAVRTVGQKTFEICQKYVNEIILVTVDEICASIKHMYDEVKTVLDPTSAMSVAGLIKYIDREKIVYRKLIAVMSGGTLNFSKLKFITQRADIGDKSEAVVKVIIPEKPGSLLKFLNYVDDSVNITQFHYRASSKEDACIIVGFSSKNNLDTTSVMETIRNYYQVEEFNNSTIIQYLPCLVGGIGKKLADGEYIFTFVLPERPGALTQLLTVINGMINISMFHYRNVGECCGNILIGLQLIGINYKEFIVVLDKIKFISYVDETNNSMLKLVS